MQKHFEDASFRDASSIHLVLFRKIQVCIFHHGAEAGARLAGIQVVMTHYQGAGVCPVQILQQPAECSLLRLGARVGRLAADVQTALVADAYRVGVVVHAVGTDHLLWASRLYLSVTTDHVVIAYTLPSLLPVPAVDLFRRRGLVGPHCRTVDN